jgi:hypothetical protein
VCQKGEKWARTDSNRNLNTVPPFTDIRRSVLLQLPPRLVGKRRPTLLHIRVKRPIVGIAGEIVGYELNKPFAYLHRITGGNTPGEIVSGGSDQVRLGACRKNGTSRSRFYLRENGGSHSPKAAFGAAARSSPVDSVSPPSKEFESPLVGPPIGDVTAFLAGLRFEHRDKLADLLLYLAKGDLP